MTQISLDVREITAEDDKLYQHLSATYPLKTANNPIRVAVEDGILKVKSLSMWGAGGVDSPACLGQESDIWMMQFPASQDISLRDYFFREDPSEHIEKVMTALLLRC